MSGGPTAAASLRRAADMPEDHADAIREYWAARGVPMDETVKIVNGMPQSLKHVTPHLGNANLPGRISLHQLQLRPKDAPRKRKFVERAAHNRTDALDAAAAQAPKTVTEIAQEIRRDVNKIQPLRYKNADAVMKTIAATYDVTLEQLKSKSRNQRLVQARFHLYYVLLNELDFNASEVGTYLDRDHTTILNGVKKFKAIRDKTLALERPAPPASITQMDIDELSPDMEALPQNRDLMIFINGVPVQRPLSLPRHQELISGMRSFSWCLWPTVSPPTVQKNR